MNTNFLRTILNWLSAGAFASIAATIAGCTGDNPATPVIEEAVCTAPWIPLQLQAIAGMAFVGLGFLLKSLFGTGSIMQNVSAPVVPVVPPADAKVGVVTPAQVATPGTQK